MNQSKTALPAYVDTATPANLWYTFHLAVLFASLGMALLAALVLEYEVAKLTHPGVSFIVTPARLDIILASSIIGLAVINLSVLLFVFLRHLWLRTWMFGTTFLGWVLLAVLALVLQARLLPILLPWYR